MTVTFAALQILVGPPSLPALFGFVLGAGTAFAGVEAAASRVFRDRVRGDTSEVVFLGSAINFFSISAALATVIGVTLAAGRGRASWVLGPFAGTIVYLVVTGLEMALAHRVGRELERRQAEEGSGGEQQEQAGGGDVERGDDPIEDDAADGAGGGPAP